MSTEAEAVVNLPHAECEKMHAQGFCVCTMVDCGYCDKKHPPHKPCAERQAIENTVSVNRDEWEKTLDELVKLRGEVAESRQAAAEAKRYTMEIDDNTTNNDLRESGYTTPGWYFVDGTGGLNGPYLNNAEASFALSRYTP